MVVTELEEEAFGGPKARTAQVLASCGLGALLEKAAAKDKKGKGAEKKKEKGKKKGGKKKEEVVGLDEETDAEAKMMTETFMEVYEGSLGGGGGGGGGGGREGGKAPGVGGRNATDAVVGEEAKGGASGRSSHRSEGDEEGRSWRDT